MKNDHQVKLERWGLAPLEAQVYLALVRSGQSLGASALASATGMPRPSVYPVLKSLVERGMVENGEGYGSEFAAVTPAEVLPRLIAAEKEKISERELLAVDLIKELVADQTPKASATKLIEVLRDPGAYEKQFRRLLLGAEREVDVFVKRPMIPMSGSRRRNPTQSESLRRGVKHRAIYESAVLDDEYVAPYLKSWIEAGEEAREYKGNLPLKLVLFDTKIAWMPLETNAPRHPVVSVLIRHHALGKALRLLFDYLWKESTPIKLGAKRVRKRVGNGAATP